jgi:hypothetical protein
LKSDELFARRSHGVDDDRDLKRDLRAFQKKCHAAQDN